VGTSFRSGDKPQFEVQYFCLTTCWSGCLWQRDERRFERRFNLEAPPYLGLDLDPAAVDVAIDSFMPFCYRRALEMNEGEFVSEFRRGFSNGIPVGLTAQEEQIFVNSRPLVLAEGNWPQERQQAFAEFQTLHGVIAHGHQLVLHPAGHGPMGFVPRAWHQVRQLPSGVVRGVRALTGALLSYFL
jgi:hypothetical protein